jgi:hypothetical protein
VVSGLGRQLSRAFVLLGLYFGTNPANLEFVQKDAGKMTIELRHGPFLGGILTLIALFMCWSGYAEAANQLPSAELPGAWRLVRTANPRGGPDAVSIMHTADTSRSDLDLAGLMIRCNDGRSELAIVVLSAFPLRARPQVTLGSEGARFEASVGPPGTALVLPGEPKDLLGKAWANESDLVVRVSDGPKTISGVVPLAGVQSASTVLKANCPMP